MANIASTNSAFNQINSLSQLHIVRQIGFMLLMAASIALGVAIVLWSTGSEYSTLYSNMSNQDSADIISALEQSGVPHKIDSMSGAITVPADQVQQAKLLLASSGLPRSSSMGFEILEQEQSLGTSNFMEQARYNRALEQELVQTIKRIQGVRDARVHLSIPKQSSFIRSSNKPSASVMIDLFRTQSVSDMQLTGILHLVASSVSGLDAENVSIVDQRGNLISRSNDQEFNNSNENMRLTRKIEDEYNNRIVDILTPIVGAGNVRVQVSADLDFTFIETTEETYDPNTSVVRSEQTQEETSGFVAGGRSVEPGSLSLAPPNETSSATQSGGTGQSRVNSTRNYEIDRSVSLIRSVPGTINQLSVAVLIDLHAGDRPVEAGEDGVEIPPVDFTELDQEKIARLTQLVKDAIGFNELRGDSVNIISEKFIVAEELLPIEPLPVWQQPWVFSAGKLSAAAFVVLSLIFGVLRPAMQSVVSQSSSLPQRESTLLTSQQGIEIADDTVSLSNGTVGIAAAPAKSVYDENLHLAQTLVQNEPARAARMIQNWLANE
jgi:flagellar M-ring protein FliF